MNPVQKALWFVESHSREPIALEDIARVCHVSPFHLTRAFSSTMGWSLRRYVRAQRLNEAATQRYHEPRGVGSEVVVFDHRGHVAGVCATFQAMWSEWFPTSGHGAVDGPTFERYGREFNPLTGLGGFELWIPIKA